MDKTKPTDTASRAARTVAHPIRRAALRVLRRDGSASPNSVAQTLGQPLGTVAYHFRTLVSENAVTLLRMDPKRGALEHIYEIDTESEVGTVAIALMDEIGEASTANELSLAVGRLVGRLGEVWPDDLDCCAHDELLDAADKVGVALLAHSESAQPDSTDADGSDGGEQR